MKAIISTSEILSESEVFSEMEVNPETIQDQITMLLLSINPDICKVDEIWIKEKGQSQTVLFNFKPFGLLSQIIKTDSVHIKLI